MNKHPLDFCDERIATLMAVRLYMLGALAWDYADSVIYQASQMETNSKKISRAIRDLRRNYDHDRQYHGIDDDTKRQEYEVSLNFEKVCRKVLKKSHKDTLTLLREDVDNCTDRGYFIMAINDALVVVDTMIDYAGECDAYILKCSGMSNHHSILCDHFLILRKYLMQYAKDDINATEQAREKAKQGLMRELKLTELYEYESQN